MKSKIRLIVGALLGVLALALIVLNWRLFVDRADLNLLFGRIEAPVGLVLLTVVLALTGLQIVLLRAQKMLDHRKYSKEIERTRAAADDQVKSHTEVMQQSVRREVAAIRAQLERIDHALAGTDSPTAHGR